VVVFAGPLMSFVLAVAAFLFIGLYWGFPDFNLPENRVGQVNPKTEAARMNLRAGDTILQIDGIKIGQGKDMTDYIHDRPGREMRLVVERDGRQSVQVGRPQWTVMYLGATWSFMRRDRALVESVGQYSAAKKAGIVPDDVLLSINSRRIIGGRAMSDAIRSNGSREVTLKLLRVGKHITVKAGPDIEWVRFAGAKWGFPGGVAESGDGDIRPDSTAGRAGVRRGDEIVSVGGVKGIRTGEQMLKALRSRRGVLHVTRDGLDTPIQVKPTSADYSAVSTGHYDAIGLFGFMPAPTLVKAGFEKSVAEGLRRTGVRVVLLIRTLTSKQIKEDVGGPVMIARATASSVALGPYYVVDMAGMLSLSLSFINLIPIPILDGGLIAILAIEAIRRKRLSPQQQAAVSFVGLMTIVVLAVTILYLDIFRISQGLVPQ
jgi:regulator of sigma E protease